MNKVILLVEDDSNDAMLIQHTLKKHRIGNEIVAVRDGAEALDYLFGTGAYAQSKERAAPAIILLDLHLPKIDGLEVLQRLRADVRTKILPVVILTSSREDQDRLQGYMNGANSYI